MKTVYFSFLFVMLSCQLEAQYSTPGNSRSWTLDSLVAYSSGAVTGGTAAYQINQDLTISITDTLYIYENATVRIASGCTVTVTGVMQADPPEEAVFTAIDTNSNYTGFRFDNSSSSAVRHVRFEFGNGNKVLNSDMLFEYCTFRKNGSSHASGALDIFQCDPVIRYSAFFLNNRAAIMSSATAASSPKITGNHIYHNDVSNGNYPQINLGTSSADTLIVQDNIVEGLYTNAGGIGISNLTGTGQLICRVENNHVFNNRYGMAFLGNPLAGLVKNNRIENNNIQNNPNLGGSGINFNGSANTNQMVVSGNIITGNLWGITIQGQAQPNLGDRSSSIGGHNIIFGNGNNGIFYALYNNTPQPVKAENNFWGSENRDSVESYIVHQTDNPSLGFVDYLPVWDTANAPSLFIDDNTIVSDTIHVGEEIENQIVMTNIGNQTLMITMKDTSGIQAEKNVTSSDNRSQIRQRNLWNTLRRVRDLEIPAVLLNAAALNETGNADGGEAVIVTDPANDFNGRPHNITGLTYPDVLSVNMSVTTVILTTLNCTTTYNSPIDTNMVGVISLDTDQDFMTGMYPPLANLGASNTDVGSEYEIIFTTKPGLYFQSGSLSTPAVLIRWLPDTLEIAGAATGITRSGNDVRFSIILLSAFDDNNMNTASGFIEVDSTFDIFHYEDYTPKHIPDAAPDLGHGRLGSEKDPSWFCFDVKSDTLIPSESDSIRFITLGTVLPGQYQATAILKSNDPGRAALKFPYYLTVLPEQQPQADLSQLMISDTITEDSAKSYPVILHNSGPGIYKFFIADTAGTPWIKVLPGMGAIPPGADLALTVSFNSAGLTPGDYAANLLMISSDTLNTVVSVPILMNIRQLIDIQDIGHQTRKFELFQNYPNPFNPSTAIRYSLANDGKVTLRIFNLLGQEVKTLVNEFQNAGTHEVVWDGTNHQNHAVSSGNYVCRLTAGKFSVMRKMMLMK